MDWIYGLLGGLMIGCAAALYLLGDGRIMGASGIVAGLWQDVGSSVWLSRALFVGALVAVPAVASWMAGGSETNVTTNPAFLVLGGLLVGYGTRLGNGCTSGHGVCGISRPSLRGIVATVTFVCVAVVVYALLAHGLGGL